MASHDIVEDQRAALGRPHDEPAVVVRVRRLDHDGAAYALVIFGVAGASTAVAAIDDSDGEPIGRATLAGVEAHLAVSADEAIALAGFAPGGSAELVWCPSPLSRSPLYPFWRVRLGASARYVNLQREVRDSIDGQGGSRPRG